MDPISAIIFAVVSAVKVAGAFAVANLPTIAIAVGAYFVNRAMAKSISDSESAGGYRFAQQTTEDQGIAIPVAYGTSRVHANIVAHYIVIATANKVTKGSAITREILACFGEGPWSAEPDSDTVRINGRPMSDWPGITATWRLGTTDQTVLPAWATFRQDFNVGQTLSKDQAVTYTLGRAGWDELDIVIAFPNGLIHYGTDGDTHSEEVTLRIEVGDAIADTWQTVFETDVSGECSQACYARFRASDSYSGGTAFTLTAAMQPRVRVTKRSGDQTNTRHVEECEFYAIQAHASVGFTHPGMVLLDLALVPNETTDSGVTELSVVTTGKVVQDENRSFAVSRYHADAIRDVMTQPVIEGDGLATPYSATYYRGLDAARLVGDGWTNQKPLADIQVPDGNGGYDDMMRCDAVFSSGSTVHSVVGQIGASGRCGLEYIGRNFGLWLDAPRTPVGLLCDGNCFPDSFDPEPVPSQDLACEVTTRYRDAATDYDERSILVVDPELETLTEVTLDLAAVTRTHEAARLARRELARNRLFDMAIPNVQADLDSVIYEGGDVLYCQVEGKSCGGRIVAVQGNTITFDRDMTEFAVGSAGVIVQHRVSGQYYAPEYRDVTLASARTGVIASALTVAPQAGDVFLFGPASIADDQFEVNECSVDQNLHASISLTKYAAVLDDLDALDPDVDVPLSTIARRYGRSNSSISGDTLDLLGQGATKPFKWGGYTFAAAGAGTISWTSDLDEAGDTAGYVTYDGVLSQPADGSTTKLYVYWDPDFPTVFSTTDLASALAGNYLIAVNQAGVPTVKEGQQIGGEGGLISIDEILDGTSYKKMTAAERTAISTATSNIGTLQSQVGTIQSTMSGYTLASFADTAAYVKMTAAERTALATAVSDISNIKTDLQNKFLQIG